MKKSVFLTIIVVCLIGITSISYAQPSEYAPDFDLSGNWIINANGWKFVLAIVQTGSSLQGTMSPLNNTNPVTHIEGTISSTGEVLFKRIESAQEYRGFVFQGIEKGRHMAGTFGGLVGNCQLHDAGWFAEYQK